MKTLFFHWRGCQKRVWRQSSHFSKCWLLLLKYVSKRMSSLWSSVKMSIFHWRGCQKRISHQTCGFPNKRLFSEEIDCFMMLKQWKAHFRTFDVFTIFTCGDPWFLAFYEHKSYGLEKYAGSQKMIMFSSHHRSWAGPLSRKRCFCKIVKIANI